MMINKRLTLRPISPHLSIYEPQITSVLSIFHRISGLSLACILILTPIIFNVMIEDGLSILPVILASSRILSPIFYGVYTLVLLMMTYHLMNGLRHLSWDLRIGLELVGILSSGIFILSFVVGTFLAILFF